MCTLIPFLSIVMVFFLGMNWSCWFCCELSKFWVFQTLRLRLEIQEKATWHYYFCNASSMPKTLKSSYLPQYCIWQYLVSGFKNDNNIIWWNACHCSHYQYNKSLTHRTTDSHPGHSSWSVYLQSYNWKKKKRERKRLSKIYPLPFTTCIAHMKLSFSRSAFMQKQEGNKLEHIHPDHYHQHRLQTVREILLKEDIHKLLGTPLWSGSLKTL